MGRDDREWLARQFEAQRPHMRQVAHRNAWPRRAWVTGAPVLSELDLNAETGQVDPPWRTPRRIGRAIV
jgi:hypothetical protein